MRYKGGKRDGSRERKSGEHQHGRNGGKRDGSRERKNS